MEPKISIVIPTLNIIENDQADDFNLVISLLDRQTYGNFEILVMDGGSNDGTVEMLKNYKNKGFLDFHSERDTGKFSALNKAIMRSKAKYITFLSCDDFFHDITAIKDVVDSMEANDSDFSFSPAYCRHPDGFVFLFPPAVYNAFQALPCPRQSMVFRRSLLERVSYFDEKFKIMADMDLIMRLIMLKAKGLYFERNYTTYKIGAKAIENPERCNEETKLMFIKNLKSLHPLTEDELDAMVNISKLPPALLEKLSEYFAPEDKELFLERCEAMYQLRMEVFKNNNKR